MMEKHGAELLLQRMLSNTSATFREGQWEAIDAVVNQRRKLLVVQRTGWGKSAGWLSNALAGGKVPCTSSPVKSSAIAALARQLSSLLCLP
ncbi:Uncharacterised protein [Shigella sonnei]|nr:Uncharacterised protein [Shigella sonnei]